MKCIIAAVIAAGISTSAFSDMVARAGDNELRLMPSPCTNAGILAELKPEWRPKFKAGQASVGKKTFPVCWIDTGEGVLWVMFADGTSAGYPVTGFLEEHGI